MARMLFAMILTIAIGGCDKQVIDTSCLAFRPIDFSASRDSPETIASVREHNAAWYRLCR